MLCDSILDAIGNTPLVRLGRMNTRPGVNVYAKLEGFNPTGSVKDRIALFMIREAEASGELTPDKIVLEPTSGNTGISLAMVCRAKGYRLLCVLPDNVTPEREALLRAFGADVVYAENATSTNDAVFKAQQMMAEDPDPTSCRTSTETTTTRAPTTRRPARRSCATCPNGRVRRGAGDGRHADGHRAAT